MKVRPTALPCPHVTYTTDDMDTDMEHYRWLVTAALKFSVFAVVSLGPSPMKSFCLLLICELAFLSSYESFVFRLQLHAAELSVSSEHTEKQKLV